MRPLLALLVLVVPLALAPVASADHPGSNLGLVRYELAGIEHLVHRLPDVQSTFATWDQTWPERVDRMTIGSTSSGFPLEGIRVTDESVAFDEAALATGEKLRVYLDGGHHGNEFLGVELVMYYLEDVLTKADAGDEATLAFLATHEVYAVPIINVDGNSLDTRKNSNLVDPNRNYDFHWGGPGSGDTPLDFTYRGPAPHSEAEVAANAAFGGELQPDLWITMHTGIAEFYWPWGWTSDPTPDDAFFTSLEAPFETATNGRVDAMQAAELYVAAGATDDYGYGVVGVPTFTYEVHEDQFVPVYGEPIPELIADQLAGLHFMVDNTQRLGVWLEPTRTNDGVVFTNTGWGWGNVSVVVGDDEPMTWTALGPGETIEVAADEDTPVTATYHILMIDTAKTRTVTVASDDAIEPTSAGEDIPGFGALVALVAAVGVALLRRR